MCYHNFVEISLRGKKVAINYFAQGQGEPIVFLHGLGGSHIEFERIIFPYINISARLIAFDQLGHGYSGTVDNVTLQDLVDVLKQFLNWLSIRKVTLVGWSMGGVTSLIFGAKYPERTKSIITYGTPYRGSDMGCIIQRMAKLLKFLVYLHPNSDNGIIKRLINLFKIPTINLYLFEYADMIRVPLEFLDIIEKDSKLGNLKTYSDLAVELTTIDLTDIAPKITAPTLIMDGNRGLLASIQRADLLAKLLPKSKVKIIKNAGHLGPASHPKQFTNIIEEFISNPI